jgi:hypothetical protein
MFIVPWWISVSFFAMGGDSSSLQLTPQPLAPVDALVYHMIHISSTMKGGDRNETNAYEYLSPNKL